MKEKKFKIAAKYSVISPFIFLPIFIVVSAKQRSHFLPKISSLGTRGAMLENINPASASNRPPPPPPPFSTLEIFFPPVLTLD